MLIGQKEVLQKEWERNEKMGSLKKAILNRKIKPYNIETHLKGLTSSMTAREYKEMIGTNKNDVIKKFFVETNKPISVLPSDPTQTLSYALGRKEDHDVMHTNIVRINRHSISDFKNIQKAGKLTRKNIFCYAQMIL